MINVETPTLVRRQQEAARARGIGPQLFWMLFAIEGLLVLGMLVLVLHLLLPNRTPLAATPDLATVREAIRSHPGTTIADSLIEVAPGITARSSNLRGFVLNGRTYYYYVEGQRNFDPLSKGAVDRSQIEVLLRDDTGPHTLVVYRVISK